MPQWAVIAIPPAEKKPPPFNWLKTADSKLTFGLVMKISPARAFSGVLTVPGDKSITHRSFLFGALAKGVTQIVGASKGDDCSSTRRSLGALGVGFEALAKGTVIRVHGGEPFERPQGPLDCGNSGTTLRLLMGLLAGTPFVTELFGDESLNGRPMERVAKPLRTMGARIETTNGRPPVRVIGRPLHGADLRPEAASAQIKSALLLAALGTEGRTTIYEPLATRDHTERMIRQFGGTIRTRGAVIEIDGPQTLTAQSLKIPGDPSSAAPFVVAALILKNSEVTIDDVLLNPFRVRYLEVLREMGANIETSITSSSQGEPFGRIIARSSALRGIKIEPKDVPSIVDELPILAVAAAYAEGRFEVTGASELRVKESDRIVAMVEGLGTMGVLIEELEDGFWIQGGAPVRGAWVRSHGDHRIAMALAIAALGARGDTEVEGAEVVSISLPGFFAELDRRASR